MEHFARAVQLLVHFLLPQSLESVAMHAEYWGDLLGEPLEGALRELARLGLIQGATPAEKLFQFSSQELKDLLRKRHLKVSGDKPSLIQRLMDGDRQGMEALTKELVVFKCTSLGGSLAGPHRDRAQRRKEEERREMDQRSDATYEALIRGRLEPLFLDVPRLLKALPPDQLRAIRVGAHMMDEFGEGRSWRWFPPNFETDLPMNREAAARMLIFYAKHKADLDQYRAMGIERVRVCGSNADDACDTCREIWDKVYQVNEAPELPFEKCRSEIGCRCLLLADFDS